MKENLTPYEILYRILSNKKYPSMIFGYPVTYDKLTMDCDITLKEEDIKNDRCVYHIEKKINVMKEIIKKLQQQKIINPQNYVSIKPILNNEVVTLFGGDDIEKR